MIKQKIITIDDREGTKQSVRRIKVNTLICDGCGKVIYKHKTTKELEAPIELIKEKHPHIYIDNFTKGGKTASNIDLCDLKCLEIFNFNSNLLDKSDGTGPLLQSEEEVEGESEEDLSEEAIMKSVETDAKYGNPLAQKILRSRRAAKKKRMKAMPYPMTGIPPGSMVPLLSTSTNSDEVMPDVNDF